jgi:CDP-diglyceride synthetase
MARSICQLLCLMLPFVLGGFTNMMFVRTRFGDVLKKPIDGGATLADGERLFGANKTWKGFFGMIVFTSTWMGLVALVYAKATGFREMSLIEFEKFSSPLGAWFYGGIWGLAYVAFELPNSYVKRRLKIPPGKNVKGALGICFTFVDQADSVIGCTLVMLLFHVPTVREVLLIFTMATGIHYAVNVALYLAGLKKQIG